MNVLKKLLIKAREHKFEVALVALLLLIVGLAHAINMFHYPYYEDDEGTYMAQAWSFAQHAKLAPYTYWYDHAPVGWMFIALWVKLTGVFTFGASVNSGRVLMFILFMFSSLSVYLIGRKLTGGSKAAAVLAVLLYSLTPVAFALQRRVLLDNIMTFWLLASVVLVLYSRQKLSRFILSGLLFGISVLSKESAAFLLPAMVYLVYLYSDVRIRKQALTLWLISGGLFVMFYPLMAFVKGELLPASGISTCDSSHVSLVGTLQYQASRKAVGSLSTSHVFKGWIYGTRYNVPYYDPFIMVGGVASLLLTFIIGIWKKPARVIALFGLLYLGFLLRGGVIIYFYIVPLVPLLALAIAYVVWFMSDELRRWKMLRAVPYVLLAIIVGYVWIGQNMNQYRNLLFVDQTTPQVQAINWMLSQHAPNSFYAIDMYGYVDLHAKNSNNFGRAEYYWKVAEDPAVYDKVLHENYKNITYIAATTQLSNDSKYSELYLMLPALKDAKVVKSFTNDGNWNVTIYKVNDTNKAAGKVSPPLNSCI